jgi:hypothetical protein
MSKNLKPYSTVRQKITSEEDFMGLTRLELVTSRLSGVRSNHLSYTPKLLLSKLAQKKGR